MRRRGEQLLWTSVGAGGSAGDERTVGGHSIQNPPGFLHMSVSEPVASAELDCGLARLGQRAEHAAFVKYLYIIVVHILKYSLCI